MNQTELLRYFDRKLKLRALQSFDEELASLEDLEREFALEALDLIRRQPAMAELSGA